MPIMRCRTQFDPTVFPVPLDLHNLLLGTGWIDDGEAEDGCPTFYRHNYWQEVAWRLWIESDVPFVRDSGHERRFTMRSSSVQWRVLWETDSEEEAYARVVEMMRGECRG